MGTSRELTDDARVVLAVYADLAPIGPQGAGPAHDHVATAASEMDRPPVMTLDEFGAAARELATLGLLDRKGHATYPLFSITAAGREALAEATT